MAVAAALTVSMLLLLRLPMAGFGGKHGEEVFFRLPEFEDRRRWNDCS
ncbi:hypothetical protein A2U01_0059032, partial [Trifolium medium]|nr:hypothetical protein [Trifolium medium]